MSKTENNRYVAYVIYTPLTNKTVINGDLNITQKKLQEYKGILQESDIFSVNLAYPVKKQTKGEMLIFYFQLPQSDQLSEMLSESLRNMDPKYNTKVLRTRYQKVFHEENHINQIRDHFK